MSALDAGRLILVSLLMLTGVSCDSEDRRRKDARTRENLSLLMDGVRCAAVEGAHVDSGRLDLAGLLASGTNPIVLSHDAFADSWGGRISGHVSGWEVTLVAPGPDGTVGTVDDVVAQRDIRAPNTNSPFQGARDPWPSN